MSVSSVLHCSNHSDPWVGSSGDCFDIQVLLLSAVALQSSGPPGSHALLFSCPPEHQSRKERWAAVGFPCVPSTMRKGIDYADFNVKKNNTFTCSAICRVHSWIVSSYRRSSLSPLAANSSGCLFGKATHSPGFVWCLPEQESLESDEPAGSLLSVTDPPFLWSAGQPYEYAVVVSPDGCSPASSLLPLVTRKVNCSKSNGEHLFHLLQAAGQYRQRMRSPHLFRTRFARSLTPARWLARQSNSECSSRKCVRPISCERTTNTTVW